MSDGRRAALSQFLAERPAAPAASLLFAANTDELARAVTSGTLVVIDGSRLRELSSGGGGYAAPNSSSVEPGELVHGWLQRLPPATRGAFQRALSDPRAWSVKRVAHASGVSTRQLVRHCRRAGCTVPPKDLLLAGRLAAAQRLLQARGRVRASELTHASGWVDGRSLRSALRRAGLASPAELAEYRQGRATLSDFIARLAWA